MLTHFEVVIFRDLYWLAAEDAPFFKKPVLVNDSIRP